MATKRLLQILAFLLIAFPGMAQTENSDYRKEESAIPGFEKPECGNHLIEQEAGWANFMAARRQRNTVVSENSSLRGRQQTTKIIPVVVHVIHDYSANTNVSKEKVLDAMRMLNDDFNKRNPDTALIVPQFKPLIADVQVEFKLATKDPDGNCTDGITRTYSALTNSANDNVKALIQWDPARYLNIWVVTTLSMNASAYASFPCGNPFIDGIVIESDKFGFTYSHSISHEAGHYFGLQHTWGMGPVGQASSCNQDDGIADTPNTIGGSTPVCNLSQVHCGNLVNIQNIMDYGGCLTMFTLGQKAVMQDALMLPCRINLWSAANLQATGTENGAPVAACAPVADFIANRKFVCHGAGVQFTDLSYNATVDSTWVWQWSFPGGTPNSSAAQHPSVVYSQPGTYPVTLTVSNSAGTGTHTIPGLIEVLATTTALQAPVAESFESSDFPAVPADQTKSWRIETSTSYSWERVSSAALDSSYSMVIRHHVIPQNKQNAMLTPNIHLTGLSQPTLAFAVAYSPSTNAAAADALKVLYSTDCGITWTSVYIKNSTALATAPPSTPGTFVPTAGQWRTETVSLPASLPYLMLKFESISGNGNNLYIDAVKIKQGVTGRGEENSTSKEALIYPNPSSGKATLRLNLSVAGAA